MFIHFMHRWQTQVQMSSGWLHIQVLNFSLFFVKHVT